MRIFTAAFLLVLWTGCTTSKEIRATSDKMAHTVVGTMQFLAIEGGCWQFRSEAGKSYELIGRLSNKLRVEGQRARIKIRLRPDLASICMVGSIAEVVEILQIY